MAGRSAAKWRHGFVPANMAAALLKAHNNAHYARKLLGQKAGPKKSPIKAVARRRAVTAKRRTFKGRKKNTRARRR